VKKRVLREEEKRCILAEGLSPVTLGKGATQSMSAAKGETPISSSEYRGT
jgi:hypothetical protein